MKKPLLIIILFLMSFSLAHGDKTSARKPVDPKELYNLILSADTIIVREEPYAGSRVLYRSANRKDIDALRESLTVEETDEWVHCACIGTPAISLYRGNKEIVQLTNHHGVLVRTSLWDSDAPIEDVERWLKWFDERNMPGPRSEYEDMLARKKEDGKARDRWMTAMPQAIRPLWTNAFDAWGKANIAPLSQALRKDSADQKRQILVLLEWFGSGAGPWSGFPSYESAAEDMLLEYSTKDIVAAIESAGLTTAQLEGAARLFGGWSFSQKRPNGLKEVPDSLKGMLWNHVRSTKDEDKLGRAKRAFRQ